MSIGFRVLCCLGLSLSGLACGAGSSATPPAPAVTSAPGTVGQPLPALSFRLLEGPTWSARSARGQVLVLDVWATYCKPCLEAFPKLNRWTRTYAGIAVVGLSVDEEDRAVREFLAETRAEFAIARDPELGVRDGPLAVTRLPTLFVVDREGIVRFRGDEMGVADYDQAERIVADLVAAGR